MGAAGENVHVETGASGPDSPSDAVPERFVYHAVVDLVPGTDSLLSASALRGVDAAAARRALAKYDVSAERRRLATTRIPLIERGWTEVVFLSPIHPHAIWSAWREVTGETLPPVSFWEIPIESVPDDAVVFDRVSSRVGDPIPLDEVRHLDRSSFRTLRQTPSANREWLVALAARGRRGAWFNLTPHVLTEGPVVLDEASIISWDEATASD